jgi:error-prone DNA polymerase
MAGVVRLHTEAQTLGLTPVIGCRIETAEGLTFLAYPTSRAAYGRLCRLISAGRMATLAGEWQDKGACDISLAMLAEHSEGVQLVLVPPADLAAEFTVAVESNVVDFVSRRAAEAQRKKEDSSREAAKPRRGLSCGAAAFHSEHGSGDDVGEEDNACGAEGHLRAFAASREQSLPSSLLF